MREKRTVGIGLVTCFLLIAACGEEIAEQRVAADAPPETPACELIRQIDLQQIFVNALRADTDSASLEHCTWIDTASNEPFVEYQVLSYSEDLQARVDGLEQELGKAVNARFVQGIGDAAVWTDVGLFANGAGRTLQVTPLKDDENRAPYQELARLLLTRMGGS